MADKHHSGVEAPSNRNLELLRIQGHDLRSPIANIRSYASMLLSRRAAPLDPRIQRAAEVIVKNADRGLRLIDDMIDLQQAEVGGLRLSLSPTSVGEIVSLAADEELSSFGEKGVTLRREIQEDLPTLSVDPALLRKAVGALLGAALRRASEGSTVTVRVELRQDEVWISVEDEGERLTSQEAALSFDKDHQMLLHRRLAPGVALALAKEVALAHGGRAGAIPKDPQGARHYLVLPFLTT